MTIAIYQPTQGAHRMHRKSLTARLWTWLTGEIQAPTKHEGAVADKPVIDAEVIDDPLDPEFVLFEPKLEQALLYDETVAAAESPMSPDWRPAWLDFTGYWNTIPVHTDDEQLALPAGSATS